MIKFNYSLHSILRRYRALCIKLSINYVTVFVKKALPYTSLQFSDFEGLQRGVQVNTSSPLHALP